MTEPFAEAAAGPIVFAYAFPHKKTQDMILRLTGLGQRPAAVLAAPHVPLGDAEGVRVRPRHADLVEPEELCRGLGIEYHVVPHESDTCLHVLDLFTLDLGVIAGARILPSAVIERFPLGILNFHPGLLPEVRGLDALQWALYHGHSLGVTAHLIDARVDAPARQGPPRAPGEPAGLRPGVRHRVGRQGPATGGQAGHRGCCRHRVRDDRHEGTVLQDVRGRGRLEIGHREFQFLR